MIIRIADLLGGTLKGAGLEATSLIWQIAENWAEIVGPRVAARAAPIRLRRNELILSAPEAVWRQELTLLGPEIAHKVNQKIGKEVVRRVRLVSGPARSPEPAKRRRRLRVRTATPPPAGPEKARIRPDSQAASTGLAAALEALAEARSSRLASDQLALERKRALVRRRR